MKSEGQSTRRTNVFLLGRVRFYETTIQPTSVTGDAFQIGASATNVEGEVGLGSPERRLSSPYGPGPRFVGSAPAGGLGLQQSHTPS